MAEEDYGLMTSHMLTTMFDLFGSKEYATKSINQTNS